MPSPRIAIASDLSLVAETVRTALLSRGYECPIVPWSATRVPDARAGLLISDMVPATRMREALALVERSDYSWLLLTAVTPGPLWGAALEGGIAGVVPNSSTLAEVDEVLQRLLEGEPVHTPEERDQWISELHEWRERKAVLEGRVASLTPRERTVLRLMYAGKGVREIGAELEVSEATVRSHVKAVLRKFHVSSQLDAVALLGWLRDDPVTLDG